ncbi:MAG: YfhO family protein, partial [Burkholderiales bacterium]|nr:YfhO family protein [Anaerolineae bacterium]
MRRRRLADILIIALLFALPLIMFWQQTLGGRTLIPAENLYQYEPFASYRDEAGAPALPQNALVSDLVLENFQWKSFIREQLAQGEIPLWNPHQFAGIPFLAAGQPSTLYPFSVIYYVLPLPVAYGWFTVVQLCLAGAFMYAFMRGLGAARIGGLIAGIVYQLSGFFVVSAVFPMIIAAAAWLPLLLLMVEFVIRQQPALRGRPATALWVAIGAVALGCNILAGHVEITYYTLMILAYWSAARLLISWWKGRKHQSNPSPSPLPASGEGSFRWLITRGAWLAVMVALGIGLGAAQFIPLFEHAATNFRVGSASYDQVIDWAHPLRDVVLFLMPNFYGSPAHHLYTDVFNGQLLRATNAAQTIDWGMKNYVEGAAYLGILPLALAAFAIIDGLFGKTMLARAGSNYRALFIMLTVGGLTLMFGLPTYALLYYLFPGIDQLHSPFRWIFAVSLGVAALAGLGADALVRMNTFNSDVGATHASPASPLRKWARRFAYVMIAIGILILVSLLASRRFYDQIAPLVERVWLGMARAPEAFVDARMFYSYQYSNVLLFGLFTFCAGLVFWLAGRKNPSLPAPLSQGERGEDLFPLRLRGGLGRGYVWQTLAVALIALDLFIAWWGFNPASDPALLDYTPPAIEWLIAQQTDGDDWRYITLEDPTLPPIMNANMGWRYGLDDVRGYESIIPKQYVDYMQQLAPQVQLDYNRVAPLYTSYPAGIDFDYHEVLPAPIGGEFDLDFENERAEALDLLNVRYIITHTTTELEGYELVYEDRALRIYENPFYMPRAYLGLNNIHVNEIARPSAYDAATITQDTGRELFIDFSLNQPSGQLIVSQSYNPGWRAYIRPQGSDQQDERPLDLFLMNQNFIGARLSEAGDWTVRLVYSP